MSYLTRPAVLLVLGVCLAAGLISAACSSAQETETKKEEPSKEEPENSDAVRTLAEVERLVTARRYESAYLVLEKADPDNNHPMLVARKVDLLIRYCVHSINHKIFALKDLPPGATLAQYRGMQPAGWNMRVFDPNEVLSGLLWTHRSSGILYRARGLYFADVIAQYGDRLEWSIAQLVAFVERDLALARALGIDDFDVALQLGNARIKKNDLPGAEPEFRKAHHFKPKEPWPAYNWAVVLLKLKRPAEAIGPAAVAFAHYEGNAKADAGRALALANYQTGRHPEALKAIVVADRLRPKDIYILFQMVEIQLALGDEAGSSRTAQAIIGLDPRNMHALSSLRDAYVETPLWSKFHTVLDRAAAAHRRDPLALANLHFQRALLYRREGKTEAARAEMIRARALFQKHLPEGDGVFGMIDEFLENGKAKGR